MQTGKYEEMKRVNTALSSWSSECKVGLTALTEEKSSREKEGDENVGKRNLRAEKEGRKGGESTAEQEMNAKFQIDRVDPSNLPIKRPLAKTKTILTVSHNTDFSAQCPDERAAKQHKALSASSHMTAVLEDIVFHFNLITMLKLQPASEHIQGLRPW